MFIVGLAATLLLSVGGASRAFALLPSPNGGGGPTKPPTNSNCTADPINGCATECNKGATDYKDCVCDPSDPKCPAYQAAQMTCNKDNGCDIVAKYINPAIVLLSALVGVVVVMAIIIGGIQYASSGGDPQKAASGRKHIMQAVIGLLAYLLLYAFLQFIIPGGKLNG